jgi:hypothetical protein
VLKKTCFLMLAAPKFEHQRRLGCLSAHVMNRAKVNHMRRFVFWATGFGVTNPRALLS